MAIAGSRVLYNQGQSRKEVPYQNDLFIVILFRGPLLYNVLIDNVNCVLYLVALFYGPLFRPSIFSWIFDRGQRQSFSGANWHAHEHWGSYLPSGNLCTAGIGRAMLASNLEWCQPVFIEHTQNLYIYICMLHILMLGLLASNSSTCTVCWTQLTPYLALHFPLPFPIFSLRPSRVQTCHMYLSVFIPHPFLYHSS